MTITKKSSPEKPVRPMYIYWCYTNLPEDYFFIYGSSVPQVKRTYNWLGGFEGNENIITHKICRIPSSVLEEMKVKSGSDVAEDELVMKAGIEFLHKDGSAFRYNGRIYREEGIFDNRYSDKELTVYLFKLKEKMRYKIGHTMNVSRRLKELSKPDQFEIISTIATINAKRIEAELLTHFKKFQIYNEYLELDEWGSFLLHIIFRSYFLEFSESRSGHHTTPFFNSTLIKLKKLVDEHKVNARPSKNDISKAQKAYELIEAKLEAYEREKIEAYYEKIGLKRIIK